jgi:hypothetical protein
MFERGRAMQQEQIITQIIERIKECADETLLDLILKLLIECGH